jgi:hypothetical protein
VEVVPEIFQVANKKVVNLQHELFQLLARRADPTKLVGGVREDMDILGLFYSAHNLRDRGMVYVAKRIHESSEA